MDANKTVLAAFSAHITGKPYDGEIVAAADADSVGNVAVLQRITPMVFGALAKSGKLGLSAEKFTAIRNDCISEVYAQASRTSVFLGMYSRFLEKGARPLCVKGIVCRNIYPEPDSRASDDEDLIVSGADFGVCREVLLANSFECDGADERGESFLHRKSGCRIELHRTLFFEDGAAGSSFNALIGDPFENCESVFVNGTEILTLSPDRHLLYLVVHAFHHFVNSGVGIRQIADIAQFVKAYDPDISFVREKCRVIRADGFLSASLTVGKDFFGLRYDGETADTAPLLDDIFSGGIYGGTDENRKHGANITAGKYAGRKQNLLRTVFPPFKKMRQRFPYLRRMPFLLPFAWLKRIIGFFSGGSGVRNALTSGTERSGLLEYYNII